MAREWLFNACFVGATTFAIALVIARPISAQALEAQLLQQQSQVAITQVTEVQLSTTETGLDIILSTTDEVLEVPPGSILGNALIVDIPNAVLSLLDDEDFQAINPIEGIARITVSNLPNNVVRVVITDLEAPPTATVRTDAQALVLAVVPGVESTEKPETSEETVRITVTAEKTPEDIQDVPISLTAISEQEIEDADITSLDAIARNTPNFSFFPGGSRSFSLYSVRGLSNSSFIANRDPIDFYVDGVPYGFTAFVDVDLPDLERVEVLRGPQSVLYGRNSLAGVVNLITRKPTNEFEFSGTASYGNFNDLDLSASISGPLIEDNLFFRLSGSYGSRDSYVRTPVLDDDEVEDYSGGTGRAQLLWTPSDAWEIALNASFDDYHEGAENAILASSEPFVSEQNVAGFNELTVNAQSLRIAYTHPDFRATSITARRYSFNSFGGDGDLTAADSIVRNVDEVSANIFSQELRLQSPEASERFEWLLGAYYESSQFNSRNNGFRFGPDAATLQALPFSEGTLNFFNSKVYNDIFAVFGQVSYRPIDALTLTTGLRYESTSGTLESFERTLRIPGLPDLTVLSLSDIEQNGEALLPRFIVEYRFTPNLMAYGSISRGYRPPGANFGPDSEETATYEAERSWNYEVGLKSSWLDDRLAVNLAIFHNPVENFQVLLSDELIGGTFTDNADVSITGFELEARARPVTGLDIIAGFGFTDAEFTDFRNPTTGVDASGNQLTYAPSFSYNLAVQYRSSMGIFGRVELQGLGETFFDDANTIKQDPYAIVNARLGYETEGFGLYLFANNLFDTEYVTQAFPFPPLGDVLTYGTPASYGVQFRTRF